MSGTENVSPEKWGHVSRLGSGTRAGTRGDTSILKSRAYGGLTRGGILASLERWYTPSLPTMLGVEDTKKPPRCLNIRRHDTTGKEPAMPGEFTPWRKHWTPEAREAARQRALAYWTPARKAEARERAQRQLETWRVANPEKAAAFDRVAASRPACCERAMTPIWLDQQVGGWRCRKCNRRESVATKLPPEPETDWRAECSAAAEGQLHQDRERAWAIMGQLAVGIPATYNKPTYNNCRRMARLLALLQWYESRITQLEMLHSPLWCPGCAEEGQEYPGNPWMLWPCETHNSEGLDAMGGNIYRSLFAEVAR